MRRGDTILCTVEALAFGGDSLAHAHDGRVVFFAGGAPGDRVTVKLDEVKPRFARGTLLEVHEAGAARVGADEVSCPLIGRCGGCQWGEATVESQRAAKQQIVERALGRLGTEVTPLVAATTPLGYRSRARLTKGASGTLGFQARRSHDVVDVPTCPLLEPALDAALQLARRQIGGRLPPGATLSGLVGRADQVHLAIEGVPRRTLAQDGLGELLRALAAEPTIAGVLCDGELFGAATIDVSSDLRSDTESDSGSDVRSAPPIDQERPFHGSADGFAQASHAGNRALRALVLSEARRLLDGIAKPRVLELYAGDGNFTRDLLSLRADPAMLELVVVESDRGACARLPDNAPGPPRPRLLAMTAADAVKRLAGGGERFDLVVLDPPRAGAADVVGHLSALTSRVLYVSCDPMTLGRDAATLAAAGLPPERATPVDLMPQTSHIETVCTLRRRESPIPAK